MPAYTRDTVVTVQPFTRQREGEEVIIGRAETGVYLALPAEAVEVLEHLAEGKSVGEAADLYQQRHGEVPDLNDFLNILEIKGIVRPISASAQEDVPVASTSTQPPPVRYHFSDFPQPLARRIFSSPALAISFLVISLAIAAAIRDSALTPRPRHLFFPDHRTLSWTILTLVSYATIFVHELGHLVAARALGINSRMGISHRLWTLVAETDLTGLWGVPKRQRFLPLFAGAIIDAVSGAVLVLLLFAQDQAWLALPAFAARLVRAMVFTYLMRLAWQCMLFVRTDFYYVIASMFNCRNLLGDTEAFLRNQLSRAIPSIRMVNQSAIPAAERRVIRVYAGVWVAGRIAAFTLLLVVTLPLAIRYARSLAGAWKTGYSANPSDFVDATLLAGLFLIPLTLGMTMWIRGLVRRERN